MDGLPHEEAVEEEPVDLLEVFLGVADGGVSDQPAMLSGQHVNMYFLYLLLFVEVGYYGFRAEADGLVGVDVPAHNWMLDLHLL